MHDVLNKKLFVMVVGILSLGVFGFALFVPNVSFAICNESDPDCGPTIDPDPCTDRAATHLSITRTSGGSVGSLITINGSLTSASTINITNTADATVPITDRCRYEVHLAAYKRFDGTLTNQTLFDDGSVIIGPGETKSISGVSLPSCASQIDLVAKNANVSGSIPNSNPDFGNSPLNNTWDFFDVDYAQTSNLCSNTAVNASCSASPNPAVTGQSVTWTGSATGGNGSYTYSWSGAGISGTGATKTASYGSTGTQTATVTATSGGQTDSGTCSVTVSAPVVTYALSVSKAGNGSGTVTSAPSGISCGSDCSENLTSGTAVTLTPTASTGSTFTGWSGHADCGNVGMVMNGNRDCTANFTLNTHVLSVAKSGTGSGTVTGPVGVTGDGISCGTNCSESYNYNTSVTLTASAASGSQFSGWSGACSGAGSCTTSMTQARSVTATFNLIGAPTVDLTCPATVNSGSTATLNWTSTGATSCTATQGAGFSTGNLVSGSDISSTLTTATTFGISCTGAGGTATDSCTTNIAATPSCSAAQSSIIVGSTATFTASSGGGAGTYSWTTDGGGTPSPYSGDTYTPQYTTVGTKTATVTSNGQSAQCSVEVIAGASGECIVDVQPSGCGTIVVHSNVPATWEIYGPQNIFQDDLVQDMTYSVSSGGLYTIIPQQIAGYGVPTVTPPAGDGTTGAADLVCPGSIAFDISYPVATIDLKANGSNGPVPVDPGETVTLTWEGVGSIVADSCRGESSPSGLWSGSGKPISNSVGEESGAISNDSIFTITCDTDTGGEVSDSVTVVIDDSGCENDGRDNDLDGVIDEPNEDCENCETLGNCTEPECRNGRDDADNEDSFEDWDGEDNIDGNADDDPGCPIPDDDDERNAVPECNDGTDNDNDGFIDWDGEDNIDGNEDDDPGCTGPTDPNEFNVPVGVTECNDGIDNDHDGLIDYAGVTIKTTGEVVPADDGCNDNALNPNESDDPDIREI